MIETFRCQDTARLFAGTCPRRFLSFRARAERKLMMLHAAATPGFLASPPGNHLEKLTGDRRGFWSIRINERWRVCFRFKEGNAYDVEIVDYH
jgi:proteic killer suppression protein